LNYVNGQFKLPDKKQHHTKSGNSNHVNGQVIVLTKKKLKLSLYLTTFLTTTPCSDFHYYLFRTLKLKKYIFNSFHVKKKINLL